MILVDTSVWVAHFRQGGSRLDVLLREDLVLVHPFVVGELACGNLKNRAQILSDLAALPSAVSGAYEEVMQLVEERKLWGLGIGWIDAHLLASALLSKCQLWTLDGRLVRAAASAGVSLYYPADRSLPADAGSALPRSRCGMAGRRDRADAEHHAHLIFGFWQYLY